MERNSTHRLAAVVRLVAWGLVLVGFGQPILSASPREVKAAFDSGDYVTAERIAAEAVDQGIWNQAWPIWLIRSQLVQGKYEDARKTYQSVINRYPTSLELRNLGIEALQQSGWTDLAKREQQQFFRIMQAAPSRFTSRENLIAAGRYFLSQGEDARQVLKLFYDRVRDRSPDYAETYIATAELAIEKADYQVAADALVRAETIDESDPRIPYLNALAWEKSDSAKATESIGRALKLNPQHVPSLLYQVHLAIDGERYETARQLIERIKQVNPQHPEAIAMLAVLSHLRGDFDEEKRFRTEALKPWPSNPLVDHAIGKKLSEKYRFAEGARYQRSALEFDPEFHSAKLQLAQDLLRLGNEVEGWQLAELVANEDEYNVVAHNLITLQDRLNQFTMLERDGIQVRMESTEAKIYGDDVLDLLAEAKDVLCKKYEVQPELPIVVEIFPEQKDFAIRTFGLPGGAGFLGVCFGRVITANSPASQGQRPSNWKSVLWHEFCHVVTLEKTKNRMPRWLSEGISVYEERQRNPAWGESMTPQYREMLMAKDLVPVSELSAAFLRPPSPMHLQFAYFHSSLVIEYIIQEHGIDALKTILDDLAAGLTINASLERSVGSLQKLDVKFTEHARQVASAFGSDADWSRKDLPEKPTIEQLQAWVADHPHNYWGLRGLAEQWIATNQPQQAKPLLEKLQQLGTASGQRGGVLELLAGVYRDLGDQQQEQRILRNLVKVSSDALPALQRLAELAVATEQWDLALEYGDQIMAIQPLLPGPHAMIAGAAEQAQQPDRAVRSLTALSMMEPVDPASIDYRLADALFQQEQFAEAKHHVLRALDEAPRYRDAHRLLLEIVGAEVRQESIRD